MHKEHLTVNKKVGMRKEDAAREAFRQINEHSREGYGCNSAHSLWAQSIMGMNGLKALKGGEDGVESRKIDSSIIKI